MSYLDNIYNPLTIVLGLVTFLLNGLLLVSFKRLKDKSIVGGGVGKVTHPLQTLLVFSDSACGLVTVVSTIQISISSYTTFTCLFFSWPKILFTVSSLLVQLMLNIERIVATAWPMTYRSLTPYRKIKIYAPIGFIFPFLYSLLTFYGADYSHKPPVCSPSAIRPAFLEPIVSYYICANGFAIGLSYVILAFLIRRSNKKLFIPTHSSNGIGETEGQDAVPNSQVTSSITRIEILKRERGATDLAFTLSTVCLFCDIIPNIILTILTPLKLVPSKDFGKYNSMLYAISLSANLAVFMQKDKLVRDDVKKIILWQK